MTRPTQETPIDVATVRDLVRLASRAPSLQNTQPWSWVLRGGSLELHADGAHRLPQTDVDGRGLTISCGAALHQLEVAAAGHGWACEVTRLPTPGDPSHLATVTFRRQTPDPADRAMLHAIEERRTDRRDVSSWEVPAARVETLIRLAAELGVLATAQDPDDGRVDALVRRAAALHAHDAVYREEQADAADGSRVTARSLPGDHDGATSGTPAWLVLSTASDDALSWLRVGEALDSIWLSCTQAGLSLVPFSEPLEVASTRVAMQHDLVHGTACPQLLVRVGWPKLGTGALLPTPRRSLDEVFRVAGGSRAGGAPSRS